MVLTVAGCGTAAPDGTRVCSGYWLAHGGVRALFDCGAGVVHNLARFRLPWHDVTHLVLTHFHNDHIGDVPMLLFALAHGVRPTRTRPLAVIGPAGTRARFIRLAAALGDHVEAPGFPLEFTELEPGARVPLGDGLRVEAGRAAHTEDSLAYRIDGDAGAFGYSGDTGPSDDVARLLRGVDTAIVECAVPDDEAMATHLTPSSLAAMARAMQPRRLVVTHVYPQLDTAVVPVLLHDAGWSGAILMAHDGMRLEVPSA
jgi:ribonuclease BN (tRNA processing enzyme)